VRSARFGYTRSRHRGGVGQRYGGSGWLVGFGQRSLGRRSLARLASGLFSLGGFGSSSCCFGWRMRGPRRRPLGRGHYLSVVARWWSYTLGCWVGWVVGWLGWAV
jgi:hypothetical protein